VVGVKTSLFIIWFPTIVYKTTFQWDEFNDLSQWTQVDKTLCFYTSEEFGHPTYN
jgi:hypothetical protein